MIDNNSSNKYNSCAIIGFILGIIAFFFNFFGLIGFLAVIFSSIGLYQLLTNNYNGKTLAILGLTFGIINIIYAFVITIFTL